MSQAQPRRPVDQPIKYGDVFSVEGEMAEKAVAPGDAVVMQSAENLMLGKTQKGATAAAMQSAASRDERAGFVGHYDINYDLSGGDEQGISVTENDLPGRRIISESVCGQDASSKLPSDRPATMRDAEGMTSAEMRNDTYLTTHPTGVAVSVAVAARLNEKGDKAP